MGLSLSFTQVIGVGLQVIAVMLLIASGCYSWFEGKPRRFFGTCLNYEDHGTQQTVRANWFFGWLTLIAAAFILSFSDSGLDSFWWHFAGVIYYGAEVYLLSRLVMLVIVLIHKVIDFLS
jgi:hypothetical protein